MPQNKKILSDSIPLTLVELLQLRAEETPDKLAYLYLDDGEEQEIPITYGELDKKARDIGGWLQSMGLQGERALLLYPQSADYIAAFFGCLYAGVITVPAYPPRVNKPMPRLISILNDSQAAVALTTPNILENIEKRFEQEPDLKKVRWLSSADIPADGHTSWKDESIPPEQFAFLQYTSGSTSAPKGVILSHANLMSNLAMIKNGFQITTGTGVFWLPSYHDMGLIGGLLEPMYVSGPSIIMPPVSFIQKPYRWLHAISKYKGTISGGPNFAYQLCVDKITPEQKETLDLSSWELAFLGAEPIRRATLDAFTEAFASCGFNPEAYYTCYGLAEATLIVSGAEGPQLPKSVIIDKRAFEQNKAVVVDELNSDSQVIIGAGQHMINEEIVIVDQEKGIRLPEGSIGEIWVHGDNVAQGYWNRPEESAATFGASLPDDPAKTYLRTGDLGFLLADELYIAGRLKDLIIIRGRNHYPQDIEHTVELAHEALAPDGGAAFSIEVDDDEKLVIVHEVLRSHRNADIEEVAEAVRLAIAKQHEIQLHALVLVRPMSIAKTSSGKIQRHAVKREYLAGELLVNATWEAAAETTVSSPAPAKQDLPDLSLFTSRKSPQALQIEAWLVAQIATELKLDPAKINVRVPFVEYGLDSVQAVSLAGELETYLGRPVPPTMAWDYPNIEILAAHLVGEDVSTVKAEHTKATLDEPIAVIGMSCRFPGADSPEAFWELLRDGVDAISEVPTGRWDVDAYYQDSHARGKMITRWGGFLDGIDQFDPGFFGISPREASRMDPQQRLLLEVAWEALENAGVVPSTLAGSPTGVYVGISSYDYARFQYQDPDLIDAYAGTGNAHSVAANRLSYVLDLRGPSMAIDTACSSSLVTIHQACQGLHTGETDLALAGGVNLILTPELNITFSQARMMAADGRCKTFDADADGYVRGEGCGMLVLKRLSDAVRDGDPIL
ncbi:MAG: AMP-binding protein, partial [Anaerolineales bacterium]|nr:AMP-binding protein [Anaerolineales bacterium]